MGEKRVELGAKNATRKEKKKEANNVTGDVLLSISDVRNAYQSCSVDFFIFIFRRVILCVPRRRQCAAELKIIIIKKSAETIANFFFSAHIALLIFETESPRSFLSR